LVRGAHRGFCEPGGRRGRGAKHPRRRPSRCAGDADLHERLASIRPKAFADQARHLGAPDPMCESQVTRAGAPNGPGLPPLTSTAIVSGLPLPRVATRVDRASQGDCAVIDLYYWPTPNGHKITMFL